MAVVCRWCRSADTQAQLSTYQCLNCGKTMTAEYVNEQTQKSVQAAEE